MLFNFSKIFQKAVEEKELNQKEICYLLALKNRKQVKRLFKLADRVRKKYVGEEIHLRGIIEFSNHCRNNCLYCGIRRDNKKIKRYRMPPKEIIKQAIFAVEKLKFRTLVLQSGEDVWYTTDRLIEIIKGIKERCQVAIAVSIGERNYKTYKKLREVGVERCLFRFETSSHSLYKKLHPGLSFKNRIMHIKWMKKLGYQVGSGPIIGVPGANIKDCAQDILFLEKYNIDMAAMGPYICHQDTPLAGSANGSVEFSLKMIAMTRIVCKNIHIPATTALQTLAPLDGRQRALRAGANILMPNLTPLKYRKYYLLYPHKVCIFEKPEDCQNCVVKIIHSVGRKLGEGYGHSLRIKKNL